jgi:hypothetical protein
MKNLILINTEKRQEIATITTILSNIRYELYRPQYAYLLARATSNAQALSNIDKACFKHNLRQTLTLRYIDLD